MNDDTRELQKRYREIDAPPYLQTRIIANAAVSGTSQRWLPAIAGAVAIAMVVLLAPRFLSEDGNGNTELSPLSLAALATMTPDRAPLPSPSLTQLRTIKSPPLPEKPRIEPTAEPRSQLHKETTDPEEQTHA